MSRTFLSLAEKVGVHKRIVRRIFHAYTPISAEENDMPKSQEGSLKSSANSVKHRDSYLPAIFLLRT